MQRPVMDPTFLKDLVDAKRRRRGPWQYVVRAARWAVRSLLSNPLIVRRPGEEFRPSPFKILARIALCWSIFLPFLTVGMIVLLVWKGTHPGSPPALTDPNSQGCFYDPVTLLSEDGTELSGWLIPVVDAHRVVEEKDRLLRVRRPAIVLVHDFGQSPQQMLPLVRPLHDEGLVVLCLGLRGVGTTSTAGQTFGVHEARDIAAGVNLLRSMAFVDSKRVAVAGIGTGGNAALLAASRDPAIKAVIVANPITTCDEIISARVAPQKKWLRWTEPICRRVFELVYHVDAKDVEYGRLNSVVTSRPTLLFAAGDSFVLHETNTVEQIRTFCRRQLNTRELPQVGSSR